MELIILISYHYINFINLYKDNSYLLYFLFGFSLPRFFFYILYLRLYFLNFLPKASNFLLLLLFLPAIFSLTVLVVYVEYINIITRKNVFKLCLFYIYYRYLGYYPIIMRPLWIILLLIYAFIVFNKLNNFSL